ncbi:nucleoside triphosphate pyrophosphohydrolase [Bacillus sp. EAC]|uniref:nucleoside triphosphate pyrophosphohydrolase n=1 Tax=Bacillus sp. EAC TaxID=1978338 RepID=UPI00211ABB00|nr:nucleoside triphosphate pyrophosphohydrolase [Bacillus sp. EAC]
MTIKYYNKLVRDKIPAVITKTGSKFETKVLSESEYIEKLNEKLKEELEEFYNATLDETVGEIADILEVLYALADTKGISVEEIERVRLQKKQDRGGFKDRILLKHVVEKN